MYYLTYHDKTDYTDINEEYLDESSLLKDINRMMSDPERYIVCRIIKGEEVFIEPIETVTKWKLEEK
jgi:hypothetical protein